MSDNRTLAQRWADLTGDPRWRVHITTDERERMGPELAARMRSHLDRLHDRALMAEGELAIHRQAALKLHHEERPARAELRLVKAQRDEMLKALVHIADASTIGDAVKIARDAMAKVGGAK